MTIITSSATTAVNPWPGFVYASNNGRWAVTFEGSDGEYREVTFADADNAHSWAKTYRSGGEARTMLVRGTEILMQELDAS